MVLAIFTKVLLDRLWSKHEKSTQNHIAWNMHAAGSSVFTMPVYLCTARTT